MRQADHAITSGSLDQASRATAERFGLDAMAQKMAELYTSL